MKLISFGGQRKLTKTRENRGCVAAPGRRMLAWALALMMVLGTLPAFAVTTLAENGEELTGGTIIAFEPLEADVANQIVPLGTDIGELDLPQTVKATVRFQAALASLEITDLETDPDLDLSLDVADGEIPDEPDEETQGEPEFVEMVLGVPVIWSSDPEYDGDEIGEYVFTAEVEGTDFIVDAEPPSITVAVGMEIAPLMEIMPLSINDVPYIFEGRETRTANSVTVIDAAPTSGTLTAGWYLFRGNWSRTGTNHTAGIIITGTVHIILEDGCDVTVAGSGWVTTWGASAGINVGPTATLHIYAQSSDSSMGKLTANSSPGNGAGAGIGGNLNQAGGNIHIHGGNITATGVNGNGNQGAGIGGGGNGAGGTVVIWDGTINATGGGNSGGGSEMSRSGAGIGGGGGGSGGNITIHGGTVTATGGSRDRNNQGGTGAGIGGGGGHQGAAGGGGTVTITGGSVTARPGARDSGAANNHLQTGAGIGGGGSWEVGLAGAGAAVTVSGGTVTIPGIGGIGAGRGPSDTYPSNRGSLTLSGNGIIRANELLNNPTITAGSGGGGIVFTQNPGTVHGNVTLGNNFLNAGLGSSNSLTVPNGAVLSVPAGFQSLAGIGTITNNGTINCATGGITTSIGGNNKANYTGIVSWPGPFSATFGQTLSNISISGGDGGPASGSFTWATPSNPVGALGDRQHAMTFTLAGGNAANYNAVNQNVTVTVNRPIITITPNAGQSKFYGAADPVFTYTPSPALSGGDAFTGALSRASGEGVGPYAFELGTLSAGDNYTLVLGGTNQFTINQATVTGVTSSIPSPTFTAYAARNSTTTAAIAALAELPSSVAVTTNGGTATLPITWSTTTGYNARGAVYAFTGTLTGNANIANGGITANATVTVTAERPTNPSFLATSVVRSGETAATASSLGESILPTSGQIVMHSATVPYTIDWGGQTLDRTAAGNSTIFNGTITYDLPAWLTAPSTNTVSRTVSVTEKTLVTISGVTVANKVYDGRAFAPSGTVSAGAVPASVLVWLYTSTDGKAYNSATPPTNAGDYKLTITVPNDYPGYYAIPFERQFSITERPITLVADNKSVTVGGDLPLLTFRVTNLAPGETAANALSANPDLACPTFDADTPGTYPIEITGGTATANYYITAHTNGTLTVSTSGGGGGGSGGGGNNNNGGGGGGGGGSPAPASRPFTSNKTDPIERAVDVFYMGLLGRGYDAGGFAHWVAQLKNGTMTFSQVAYHILFSDEAGNQNLTNEQFVTRLYNGLLGRNPDTGGLNFWAAHLGRGVSKVAIFNAFIRSPEFAARMAALGLK